MWEIIALRLLIYALTVMPSMIQSIVIVIISFKYFLISGLILSPTVNRHESGHPEGDLIF
jgi:hypothetical protein